MCCLSILKVFSMLSTIIHQFILKAAYILCIAEKLGYFKYYIYNIVRNILNFYLFQINVYYKQQMVNCFQEFCTNILKNYER